VVLTSSCSGQWLSGLFFAPEPKRSEQLTRALKKGALAHYGFEIEFKKELDRQPGWVGVGNITGSANFGQRGANILMGTAPRAPNCCR